MQAVISLLPEPYNAQVERIWNHLEDRFGLKYIRITPIPHFTWQLGEGYQEENVLSLLHELALRLEPFEVRTNGLNHFAGISPILFIEVRKSVKLTKLHTQIWNQLFPLTLEPSPLYSIETWHAPYYSWLALLLLLRWQNWMKSIRTSRCFREYKREGNLVPTILCQENNL